MVDNNEITESSEILQENKRIKLNKPEMIELRIRNLPRACKSSKFTDIAKTHGIDIFGCRKPSKNVAFADVLAEMKDVAVKALDGLEVGGRRISVSVTEGKRPKSARIITPSNVPEWERLNDKVTPLWRKNYSEQLEHKQKLMTKLIDGFARSVNSQTHTILDIIGMPDDHINGYRNKCEYSFGKNEKDEITLGFMLGMFKEGVISVASPQACPHINERNKALISIIEKYAQNSQIPVYDRESKLGYWRLAIVRSSHHNPDSLMLIVQTHRHDFSESEQLEQEQKLLEYLNSESEKVQLSVSTVLWQIHEGVHNGFNETAPLKVLKGTGLIRECLKLGSAEYQFQISPQSFFQSNTVGAEILYGKIHEWSVAGDEDKLVLDLCCGTGTIGITMTHFPRVKKIIGIELVQEAVNDCKINAELNNLEIGDKLEYICDKVEVALGGVIERLTGEMKIVAILDPPRAGVHKDVIRAIRNSKIIDKVVYVSCNPKAAAQNWVDLCKVADQKFTGSPFVLSQAQPVDMFPHTEHCEMILEFNR